MVATIARYRLLLIIAANIITPPITAAKVQGMLDSHPIASTHKVFIQRTFYPTISSDGNSPGVRELFELLCKTCHSRRRYNLHSFN